MMLMHIFDTLKQFFVESDIIGMLRQDWTHLLGQGIHLIVGLSRQQIEEYSTDTTQQVIIALTILLVIHTDDGIVESWFLGIVDNLVYLFLVTTDTLHKRLLIVLQTDTVKGHRVVRCIVFLEKGVESFLFTHNILHFSACKNTNNF